MSSTDKNKAKLEQARGMAKEIAGRFSGHKRTEADGRTERSKGDLREAVLKLRDAVKR
ncbi:CsbD family protein [Streptomyces sp. NPDC048639]|uniref:CsbD family protein n=1 Tax=Streptomyces sp. NPDC048639 TaxID=3365581 RepID=UPI0037165E1E